MHAPPPTDRMYERSLPHAQLWFVTSKLKQAQNMTTAGLLPSVAAARKTTDSIESQAGSVTRGAPRLAHS